MLEPGLYSMLAADTGLAALVGNGIYLIQAPECAYPCVTYKLFGGPSDPTLETMGTIEQRAEFNAFAETGLVAAQIRDAVIAAVANWRGLLADGSTVLSTRLVNAASDFEPGEDRIFRMMTEFYILYTTP